MSAPSSTSKNANEMFEQAARLFESAMQAGIRIQEQSIRSMAEMTSRLGSPQDWQKQAQSVMDRGVSTLQQNADEALRMMQENAKTSLELLEKAFRARQGEPASETQNRVRETWETAIGSLRRNTEVMLQSNGRVLESWRDIARMMQGEKNGAAHEGTTE